MIGLLGIVVLIGLAWLLSKDRRLIPWKTVGWGLTLQVAFAVLILGIPKWGIPGLAGFVFRALNSLVTKLVGYTDAGAQFVFGSLASNDSSLGFIFAFRALPTIIFFSSFTAVLFHLGILQKVVRGIAWLMARTMKASGAESLSAAANIFIGQTEAPLLVKPYIPRMTRSELFCVMVGGMATVAAGVMGAYIGLLQGRLPEIAGHLLTASAMSAPAAVIFSKMLVPEDSVPLTMGTVKVSEERPDTNAVEAAARGASEGMMLALNVGAMLVAFIALIALLDGVLGSLGGHVGWEGLSFSKIMGWVFAPFAWLMGVPWSESGFVGRLLGEKVVLNEFVAYVNMAKEGANLSDRSLIITSYALCGFSNFSSIGIQIGGIGTLAPNQRSQVARLGVLAVVGGTFACFLTGAIAGLLY